MNGSQEENTLHGYELIKQVRQGKLRGTIRRTVCNVPYASFLNISYAAPPIGNLRFKDPQPPDSWEGIRDANQDENVCCAQMTRYPEYRYIGSEDCLYLNIYVPFRISRKTGIAVMVWIHGGYFSSGSGNFTDVRPDYLMEKDIILVTINYRLGAFGFLNLGHSVASGNQGLKDQVAALQWIKENIAVFGGDPKNITVFGSNVGAVCVHLLMLSPSSRNLFHKAILQGGAATMNWAIENNDTLKYSYKLAKKLGCMSFRPQTIVEFLNKLPAIDVVIAQFSMLPSKKTNMCRVIFGPSIDTYARLPFLDKSPRELLDNGNHKPVILGHTSCEYLKFLDGCTEKRLKTLYHALLSHARALLPYGTPKKKIKQFVKRCQKYYFWHKSPIPYSLHGVLRCYSDIYFNIPINMIADERRKLAEAPTYVYEFSYLGNQMIIDKNLYCYYLDLPVHHSGVSVSGQGDDLAYLFYTPNVRNIITLDTATDDFKMIQIMTSMWTNFARTGDPIPVENECTPIKWMPATKENLYYLDINKQLLHGDRTSTIACFSTLLGK